MSELKPCPFCGSNNIKVQSGTGLDLNTQYNGRYVYCQCGVFMRVKSYYDWNTRPENKHEKMWKRLKKVINEICEKEKNIDPDFCTDVFDIKDDIQQIEKELK